MNTRPRKPGSRLLPRARSASLLLLAGVLVGCSSSKTYEVEVRNGGRYLVRAQIVLDPPLQDDVLLTTEDVKPGERGVLGPVEVKGPGEVLLSVTRPSEIGLPPVEERLSSGRSVYETGDQSNFGVDGVRVTRVREPGDD